MRCIDFNSIRSDQLLYTQPKRNRSGFLIIDCKWRFVIFEKYAAIIIKHLCKSVRNGHILDTLIINNSTGLLAESVTVPLINLCSKA